MIVSVGSLDLQLPMQSMHITTKVVSSNPHHGEVYSGFLYEWNLLPRYNWNIVERGVKLLTLVLWYRKNSWPPLFKLSFHYYII